MSHETDTDIEAETIAATQPVRDVGDELRRDLAEVLGCQPDELHPDKERRADA